MIIRPRKLKYNKSFRLKKLKTYKRTKLAYGNSGIKVLNSLLLTARHISKFILIFKRYTKRSNKTFRNFWVNFPVNIPFSEAAKGSRMGKGKGKVTTWGFRISSGNYFLELKGLRYGRLLRLHKQLSNALPAEVTTKVASTKTKGLHGMPAFYLI